MLSESILRQESEICDHINTEKNTRLISRLVKKLKKMPWSTVYKFSNFPN